MRDEEVFEPALLWRPEYLERVVRGPTFMVKNSQIVGSVAREVIQIESYRTERSISEDKLYNSRVAYPLKPASEGTPRL